MTDFFAARIIHREMKTMTDLKQKLESLRKDESARHSLYQNTDYDAVLESCLIMLEALESVDKACVCTRNTYGFDYAENHRQLGKPGMGKRWLTPRDIIKTAIATVTERMR